MTKKRFVFLCLMLSIGFFTSAQSTKMNSYCNPINIDYTYMIYNSKNDLSYRSGADPAVVEFRGEYYMFVTRSLGYWHSTDLQNWNFIEPEKWYFQGSNAPAAHNYKDSVLYVTGDPSGQMSVLYTDNPKKGDWKIIPAILTNLQDPGLYIDDDDQAYVFWGSSNKFPIRGKKLEKNRRFIAEKNMTELFNLDLEDIYDIQSVQINFHDHQSGMYGRYKDLRHRYLLESSVDGINWETLADKSNSFKDTPNDYIELDRVKKGRYIRYTNVEVPTPSLAISDIRVFGNGSGKAPSAVKDFKVERKKDRRDAMISWKKNSDCQGYNILWGIAPDKLCSSWMVYGDNQLEIKSLTVDQEYYFCIESFNENGISKRTPVIKVD